MSYGTFGAAYLTYTMTEVITQCAFIQTLTKQSLRCKSMPLPRTFLLAATVRAVAHTKPWTRRNFDPALFRSDGMTPSMTMRAKEEQGDGMPWS